uniref:Uncharacterized protein n=1 Tax=Myoviridae sp. ctZhr26 TaxID=2827694 RepID=A0A8S5T8V3_9CAUD|nr:MAG TPA: hypothetical protein [Myoviridae sp. ctZhr26]DAG73524.1 MAG TPA: hypothetical protein [Caudoviricetes sp.]
MCCINSCLYIVPVFFFVYAIMQAILYKHLYKHFGLGGLWLANLTN